MPTARIATEFAMIHWSPTRSATAAPTMEQATAPRISEAIGAKSELDQRSAYLLRQLRIRLAGLEQLPD